MDRDCSPADLLPCWADLSDVESHYKAASRSVVEAPERSPVPTVPMDAVEGLWRRVDGVRGRMVRMVLLTGFLRVAGLVLGVVGALLLGDYLMEWPRWVRGCALIGLGGAAVAAGVAWCWWPWRRLPNRDAWVLALERRLPGLRSRLISTVQLARETPSSPEAQAFVGRLVLESGAWATGLDARALVSDRPVRKLAWRVGLGLVAGWMALGFGWPVTGVLLRRFCLEEVALPRRTRIVALEVPSVVGRGDDVPVRVRVEGVKPRAGVLRIRHGSGRLQELSLDAELEGGAYSRVVAGVPATFRFTVRVNDAESEERGVEVLPRPVITNLVLTQELPAYTGGASRRVKPGELSLLRGSTLRVEAVASQSLREAQVRLVGVDRRVPLGLVAGGLGVSGAVVIDDARIQGFSVELVDAQGISSRDTAVYAVDVVEDAVPQVRILVPTRREELVTARGTMLVAIEARDDFGLGALRIRHQAASATNGEPGRIELDLAGETNAVVRRRFEWRLSSLQPPLPEGGLHEFWVEAEDRNTVAGAQTGRSERYLLRVVTEAEKRADLLGRAGDAIARLGEVAQGQERLNDSLGRIILSRTPSP